MVRRSFLLLALVTSFLTGRVGAASLVINEVSSRSLGNVSSDWIELLVVGNAGETVEIKQFSLSDRINDPAPICKENSSFVVGSRIVVEFSKGSSANCSFPGRLGECDHVKLRKGWMDAKGAIVDEFEYCREDSVRGDTSTFARLPDGTGNFEFGLATPGQANRAYSLDPTAGTQEAPALFDRDSVLTVDFKLDEETWTKFSSKGLDYVKGDLSVNIDGELISLPNVGVRAKGQSSLMMSGENCRFPLKVSVNEYRASQRLGQERLRKFVLNPGFQDSSMSLREWMGYKLFNDFGVPAPRTRFADVKVNGHRVGLYLLVETIDQPSYLRSHFPGYSAKSAAMYKPELQGMTCNVRSNGSGITAIPAREETTCAPWPSMEPWPECKARPTMDLPGMPPGGPRPGMPPPGGSEMPPGMPPNGQGAPPNISVQQSNVDLYASCLEKVLAGEKGGFGVQMGSNHSSIVALTKMLDEDAPLSAIERHLNRTTALRFLAVATALAHLDTVIGGMEHNFYLFDPEGSGLFELLPWDLNMAFDGFPGCMCGNAGQLLISINASAGCGANSIIVRHLLSDQASYATYANYIGDFASGPFAAARTVPMLERIANIVRPFVEVDPTRGSSLFDFDVNVNVTGDPFANLSLLMKAQGGMMGSSAALGRFFQARPKVLLTEVDAYRSGKPVLTEEHQSFFRLGKGGNCRTLKLDDVGLSMPQMSAPTNDACNGDPGSSTPLPYTDSAQGASLLHLVHALLLLLRTWAVSA